MINCIEVFVCIVNILGFLLNFLDALTLIFSSGRVSDRLLANARLTRCSRPSQINTGCHFHQDTSSIHTPKLKAQAAEVPIEFAELRGANSTGTMHGHNTTTPEPHVAVSSFDHTPTPEAVGPIIDTGSCVVGDGFEKGPSPSPPTPPCAAAAETMTSKSLSHHHGLLPEYPSSKAGENTVHKIDVDINNRRRAFSIASTNSDESSSPSTMTSASNGHRPSSPSLRQRSDDEFISDQIAFMIKIEVPEIPPTAPSSLSHPTHETSTSSTPTQEPQSRTMEIDVPPSIWMPLLLQDLQKKRAEEATAMAASGRQLASQTEDDVAPVYATSCGEDGHHVHTYRPDLHTIAALVAKERSVADGGEAATPGLDTAFLPQAVQQHEKTQQKRKEARGQRSGQSGKKAKKVKKNTGRLNKQRQCAEKALQLANGEVDPVDDIATAFLPRSLHRQGMCHESPEGQNLGDGRDATKSEKRLKKKSKRHNKRVSRSLKAEQQVSLGTTTHETKLVEDCVVNTAHDAIDEYTPSLEESLASSRQECSPRETSSSTSSSHDQDAVPTPPQEEEPPASSTTQQRPLSHIDLRFGDFPEPASCGQTRPCREYTKEETHPTAARSTTSGPESSKASPDSSEASAITPTTPFDVETHVNTLLSRSAQQQQHAHGFPNKQQSYVPNFTPAPPPPPPYHHDRPWQPLPEPLPYYQPEPTGFYPFPDQLPEYFPPYYDYEPYAGFPQHQYYEPRQAPQNYGFFESQVLPHLAPCVPPASSYYRAPIPEEPEVEMARCHGHGNANAAAQKPWYLQPLVYEEEKEREFEAGQPSQRMRLMKACRKYGL